MPDLLSKLNARKSSLLVLYILGFIISLRFALPAYVTSSFLGTLIGEKAIGYIFALGSVLTLIFFYLAPRILKKYGNRKTALFFSFLTLLFLLGMVFLKNTPAILLCFIISSASATIVGFSLDIFVEHDSATKTTGNVRGKFLAILNAGWLASPLLMGLIVAESSYRMIFLASALAMAIFTLILFFSQKSFSDPDYARFSSWETIKEIFKKKNVRFITMSYFLLQFFYAWMVIYTPIYLNIHIGLDWFSIGKIFTVMLLPFVIFEAPLGKLADKRWGEKEMLSIGFIIIAIFTAIIPFINDKSLLIWATILFLTRIGAAMVEVMCDTYFFKNIGEKDANLISFYRSMTPVAYIIAPITASVFLIHMPMSYLFPILGILMIFGLRYSLAIKDTK